MRRAAQAAIPDTLLDAIKIAVASAVTNAHEQALEQLDGSRLERPA